MSEQTQIITQVKTKEGKNSIINPLGVEAKYVILDKTYGGAFKDTTHTNLQDKLIQLNKSIKLDKFSGNASGAYSTAFGYNTLAEAEMSHAEGRLTSSKGRGSHSEGDTTCAGGQLSADVLNNLSTLEAYQDQMAGAASHAEGIGTQALKVASHAEGYKTQATGMAAHAEGEETTVTAEARGGHAEGWKSIVSGYFAHAEGWQTEAQGGHSHAEGSQTLAYGMSSHAEGYNTEASGSASHAEGFSTVAKSTNSHAEGQETEANANSSHVEGYKTRTGSNIPLINKIPPVINIAAHAEGIGTCANNKAAHAEGMFTIAEGVGSHAEGYCTSAQGAYSHAEGYSTSAQGMYSHVEGVYNNITTHASHVEGRDHYITSGDALHVEGIGHKIDILSETWDDGRIGATLVSLNSMGDSHIEVIFINKEPDSSGGVIAGEVYPIKYPNLTQSQTSIVSLVIEPGKKYLGSIISGENLTTSFVLEAITSSTFNIYAKDFLHLPNPNLINISLTHVLVSQKIWDSPGAHIQGCFSDLSNDKYAHVVGNGSSNLKRSNAHTLDWNGNAMFAGDIKFCYNVSDNQALNKIISLSNKILELENRLKALESK